VSGPSQLPGEPINRVRRRDRAVEDDAWIRAFLREAPYGVVATESGGQPFMNPVVFAYDEESNSLYFHTGRKGRIFANIAANPRVCFNACRMLGVKFNVSASSCDVQYESVIVFGRARVLDDDAQAERGLRLLLSKHLPDLRYGEDYHVVTAEQLARTAVYRIEIEAWSGKRNVAAAHTP
jgi:hypothetical protein